MKKFLLVLPALLLAGCAPTVQGFVALPDDVKIGLTAVVVWVVSFFFAKLLALVPYLKFLEQFREPLALAIAAALIGVIETNIPDAYATVAVVAIQLLLAILAMFGVGRVLKTKAAFSDNKYLSIFR
jgi:hypothetical protein